ncbi:hypothetical protein FACS189490_01200 [Clostridia bacterium]|nr:hypothetical protein FACS189490_01200 [Clostridia bacterium]
MGRGRILKRLLFILWLGLTAAFITFDFSGGSVTAANLCKFGVVLCCFSIALFSKEKTLKTPMALTVLADYFIILTDRYALGVLIFCAVQTLHSYRHFGKISRWFILRRVIYLAAAAFAYVFAGDILTALCAFYVCSLLESVFSAFLTRNKTIIAAMVLFLFCDLFVLLFNLALPFSDLAGKIIWLFYSPSQLLLALSKRGS